MPNSRFNQTAYIGPVSTIESMNVATLYKPGELGSHCTLNGKDYQIVQLDSGATAATGAGVVAANQLAFWKDKANYIVTNDKAQAIGGPTGDGARNALAGIFRAAVTAGYYGVIQDRGQCNVLTDGGGAAIGDQIVAKGTGTATATGVKVTQGTAPTVISLGVVTTAESGTTTVVSLNLPQVQ